MALESSSNHSADFNIYVIWNPAGVGDVVRYAKKIKTMINPRILLKLCLLRKSNGAGIL